MPGRLKDRDLDDIQVLGQWNFTLQAETPIHWLRTGALDRYLLRFGVQTPFPVTCGFFVQAEVDGDGSDGVSLWMERRPAMDGKPRHRRYVLAGNGLDSNPVVTREFPDDGGLAQDDVEVLVQGYQTVVFLHDRQVQIKCRTKNGRGSVGFFNSTQGTPDGVSDDVYFSEVRITALRRGPLEVGGILGRREQTLREQSEGAARTAAADAAASMSESSSKPLLQRTEGSSTFQSTSRSPGSGARAGSMPGRRQQRTQGQSSSPWVKGGQAGGIPKSTLHQNFSESSLRKSGVALCGRSPASKARGATDEWVGLAVNAPASEQAFLKSAGFKQSQSRNACKDFISF